MQGYPSLAALVDASSSFRLFRRFGWIRARRLLYLQTELSHLEAKIREADGRCTGPQRGLAAEALKNPDLKRLIDKAGVKLEDYGTYSPTLSAVS